MEILFVKRQAEINISHFHIKLSYNVVICLMFRLHWYRTMWYFPATNITWFKQNCYCQQYECSTISDYSTMSMIGKTNSYLLHNRSTKNRTTWQN